MDLLLSAHNPKQLSDKLRALDLHGASEMVEPEKRAIELYGLVCLLLSVPWSSEQFPLQLFKYERPDFVLSCNGSLVGLEHTEAIDEHAAKVRHQRLQQADPGQVLNTPLLLRESRLPGVTAELNESDTLPAEQYWANSIGYLIQRKSLNAQKEGYQRYRHNQLMIQDNLNISLQHHSSALSLLRTQLDASLWLVFERIYILDEQLILELGEHYHSVHRLLRP